MMNAEDLDASASWFVSLAASLLGTTSDVGPTGLVFSDAQKTSVELDQLAYAPVGFCKGSEKVVSELGQWYQLMLRRI
ncbi:hypothetical protein Y032_0090g2388 [Ancylostoma ceylanicum]|uniref:Uncharacterized protein n=1 Tax=Ancylostoma ceylanicum TaxID=53326 RepID=A0A016TNP2_9BILA|nr:hypothetical protein Y032_0090g2388 [Ancylostoma ceylanicum]